MYTAKNQLVIDQVLPTDQVILDVGCGNGATALAIKSIYSSCKIVGLNHSEQELEVAKDSLDEGLVFDLNGTDQIKLNERFNLIICSHILEHLVQPNERVKQLSKHLNKDGRMILIVPNFAIWKARFKLLRGKFDYQDHGLYDRTHLRFYTWDSFPKEVVPSDFKVLSRHHSGNFPLPILRRFLPQKLSSKIDHFFLTHWPNLFSSEIGLVIGKDN